MFAVGIDISKSKSTIAIIKDGKSLLNLLQLITLKKVLNILKIL